MSHRTSWTDRDGLVHALHWVDHGYAYLPCSRYLNQREVFDLGNAQFWNVPDARVTCLACLAL